MKHIYVKLTHEGQEWTTRVEARDDASAVVKATAVLLERGVTYTQLQQGAWEWRG